MTAAVGCSQPPSTVASGAGGAEKTTHNRGLAEAALDRGEAEAALEQGRVEAAGEIEKANASEHGSRVEAGRLEAALRGHVPAVEGVSESAGDGVSARIASATKAEEAQAEEAEAEEAEAEAVAVLDLFCVAARTAVQAPTEFQVMTLACKLGRRAEAYWARYRWYRPRYR